MLSSFENIVLHVKSHHKDFYESAGTSFSKARGIGSRSPWHSSILIINYKMLVPRGQTRGNHSYKIQSLPLDIVDPTHRQHLIQKRVYLHWWRFWTPFRLLDHLNECTWLWTSFNSRFISRINTFASESSSRRSYSHCFKVKAFFPFYCFDSSGFHLKRKRGISLARQSRFQNS